MRRWLRSTYGVFEIIVASLAFWWGMRTMFPWGNVFDDYGRFRVLMSVLPTWVWGGAVVGMALWLVVSSVLARRNSRRAALGAIGGFFLFLASVYFLDNRRNIVMLSYFHWTALCAWLLWVQGRRT